VADRKFVSFAPKDLSEGSNLFDNVKAAIENIQLTKEGPDNYQAEGNPIFANVSFLLDGPQPEEERKVQQSYSLGAKAGDNFEISEDGYGLYEVVEGATARKDSKFGTFVSALANEGVPASLLESGNFKALVGLVGQFKRVADKERSFGADRPGRKASKFPPSTLVCVKLYSLPGQKAAGTQSASTGTSNAGSTETPAGDLDSSTMGYLLDVLSAAKDNKIQRANLTLALTKAALAKNDGRRTEIAKLGADEAFLKKMADEGLIKYDSAAKPQVVYAA
jgi:hypothetical protein